MRIGSGVLAAVASLVLLIQGAPGAGVRISGIEVTPTVNGATFTFRDWVLSVGERQAVISYTAGIPLDEDVQPARVALNLPTGAELPPPVELEKLPHAIAVSVQTALGMARTLLEEERVLKAYVDEPVMEALRAISHGRFRMQAEARGGRLETTVSNGYFGDSQFSYMQIIQGRFRVRAWITAGWWRVSGEMWLLETEPRSRMMAIAHGEPEGGESTVPDARFRLQRLGDGRIVLTESYWSREDYGSALEVAQEYLAKVQRAIAEGQVEADEFATDQLTRMLGELGEGVDVVITEGAGVNDE